MDICFGQFAHFVYHFSNGRLISNKFWIKKITHSTYVRWVCYIDLLNSNVFTKNGFGYLPLLFMAWKKKEPNLWVSFLIHSDIIVSKFIDCFYTRSHRCRLLNLLCLRYNKIKSIKKNISFLNCHRSAKSIHREMTNERRKIGEVIYLSL